MIWYLMILHFVSDFLLQSREIATKKSSSIKHLSIHIIIIFLTFLVGTLPLIPLGWLTTDILIFCVLNALAHMLIDGTLWNLYKLTVHYRITQQTYNEAFPMQRPALYEAKVKGWKYYEDHMFYATIGLDQLLHYLTIVILYGYWS